MTNYCGSKLTIKNNPIYSVTQYKQTEANKIYVFTVSTLLESTIEWKNDNQTERQMERETEKWLQHTYMYTQIPGNNNYYFCTHDCMVVGHLINTKWLKMEEIHQHAKQHLSTIMNSSYLYHVKTRTTSSNISFCCCFFKYKQFQIYKKHIGHFLLIFVSEPF